MHNQLTNLSKYFFYYFIVKMFFYFIFDKYLELDDEKEIYMKYIQTILTFLPLVIRLIYKKYIKDRTKTNEKQKNN